MGAILLILSALTISYCSAFKEDFQEKTTLTVVVFLLIIAVLLSLPDIALIMSKIR